MKAAEFNHEKVVTALINYGVNLDKQNDVSIFTIIKTQRYSYLIYHFF